MNQTMPTHVHELHEATINGERLTPAEQMRKPGDFYYAKSNAQWKDGAVMLNCPKCNVAGAYPLIHRNLPEKIIKYFYRLINFRGEPLTMEPGLVCPYCRFTYKIHHGEITMIENEAS